MPEPADILNAALQRATIDLNHSLVADSTIRDRVEYVAGNVANKAGVRLLMACLLAKIHNPSVDVRKPYTKIGGVDSFSGRKYDENYVQAFVNLHALQCHDGFPDSGISEPQHRSGTMAGAQRKAGAALC